MEKPRQVVRKFLARPQHEGVGAVVRRSIGRFELRYFDPFLVLDEFSVSAPAGFPDHPHRGFETVTYMLEGAVTHEDFEGHRGTIKAGDVQWMTAGRGIVHSEMPAGPGTSRGLQLWVNLSSGNKMVEPGYQEFQSKDIACTSADGVTVRVIAGHAMGARSPVCTRTPTMYLDFTVRPRAAAVRQPVPPSWNAFAYVLEGEGVFGAERGAPVAAHHLLLLGQGDGLEVWNRSDRPLRFLLIAGEPIGEPVAQLGPFVMNTEEEIDMTVDDFERYANGFEKARHWKSRAMCFVPAPIKAAKPFLYSTLREAIERHGGAAKERRNGTVLFSRLPFPFCHGSAARLLGELVGGRDEAAAARARLRRRPPRGGAVLLRAQGRAREQVPGRRVGPAGVRARLRPGGPRRPPRGAQHARRPGLGVPVVDHGRRAARRRVHGAALPLPGLRHLLLRRRRQGLHGRRHLPRPRQLHPRARHRALRHPPPPRPQHHVPVLRRPGEAAPAAAGHLRHHRVHQHVDPQHGVHRHDGAGGDGDPAAVPARPAGVRRRRRRPGAPALLQGAGARHHVRVHHRRHGDADGHGRQHHPGGDVVHLLPGPAPHHLQLLDVLRAPHGARPVRGALGHALPHVLHQEHREGALRVPRQESPQEGAQPNGSDGVCREDGFGRLWGSHCPMDDPEPDGRHPWVGSPLRRQSWGWDSHYPDDDAAVHHPERQERRREAHGLGQVPEAAVAHHPAPRRGLRHRRRVQVQRPHGHPLLRAGLPEGRAGAGHRARGLRLQRPHHRVHLRRRHHHAGAAAAGRAGQVHRRAPAAAHGPRHRRRAALVPAAHRDAGERRRVQHRVHHHQGHGAHWNAVEARRRCSTHDSAANVRFSGFWHGFRSCKNVSGTQLLQAFLFKRRILFSSNLAGVNLIPTKFLQVLIHDCSFLEHFNLQTVGCLEVHSLVGRSVFLYRGMSVPMPHEGYGVVFFASAPT